MLLTIKLLAIIYSSLISSYLAKECLRIIFIAIDRYRLAINLTFLCFVAICRNDAIVNSYGYRNILASLLLFLIILVVEILLVKLLLIFFFLYYFLPSWPITRRSFV